MNAEWQKHISIDPEIHHGEPCITGTRIPVSMILGSIDDGMTIDEILSSYPQLSREAAQAVLAYRGELAWEKLLELGEKLGKEWKSEKSAVDFLSEMRR